MQTNEPKNMIEKASSFSHNAYVSSHEIWSLTCPQALMMLLQFLVGFTDIVVAGRIHPHVQASFGIIMQCQYILLVVGFALGNGGIAAMSQSLGARRFLRATRFSGLIVLFSLALCCFIVFFGYFFRRAIFTLLCVPQELYALTESLWVLLLWAIPLNYIIIQALTIFRSHRNVFVPLWSACFICFVNFVGDLGFGLGYFGFPCLGAHGLIISTIGSLSIGALFNVCALWKLGFISRRMFAPFRWQKKAAPYLLKVALPSGASQLLWQLGYLVLFSLTASLPLGRVTALAGMTAGMRVEAILFLPAVAFGATGSVLVGRCLGAGEKAEAKRVGSRIIVMGCLAMSGAAMVLYPFVPLIAAFVAPAVEVQTQAVSYIRYNLFATPFTVINMIATGILTGAGASFYSMAVNSLGIWCIRLPLAWFLGHLLWGEASGIFLAMFISQFIQGTALYVIFDRCNWFRFALRTQKVY